MGNCSRRAGEELQEKTGFVEWFNEERKEQYGIIARKIEDKEGLREKDFLAYDLEDWKQLASYKQ